MPELNVNLPPIEVLVQKDYLYGEMVYGEEPAVLISAASVPGQPLLFQVLLKSGALYERLPVEALRHLPFDDLSIYSEGGQIWDCPGPNVTFDVYDTLQDAEVQILQRKEVTQNALDFPGRYVGTFDWWGSPCSDGVGEYGHKAAHLIAAGDGTYWLLPNDYLLFRTKVWSPEADVTKAPRLQRNRERYSCEGLGWLTPEALDRNTKITEEMPDWKKGSPVNQRGPQNTIPYNIPEGWVLSQYRIPQPGDWVWDYDLNEPVFLLSCDPPHKNPAWIFIKCDND